MKTRIYKGRVYGPTVIPRVYIAVDTKKGVEALETFNRIYKKFKPGGKILKDIEEMKAKQSTGIFYEQV